MRRVRNLKMLFVVAALLLISNPDVVAQNAKVRAVFEESGFSSSRLKGASGELPSLLEQYCSEDGKIVLTAPPNVNADDIKWTIVGWDGAAAVDYTTSWGEKVGSGATATYELDINKVTSNYYTTNANPNAAEAEKVYVGYQYFKLLLPINGASGTDYTSVYLNPTQFTLSGGASICDGVSTDLTLSDSQNLIRYFLLDNGVETGDFIDGDGGSLVFTVTNTGKYTVVGRHTLNGACETTMAGEIDVLVYPSPTPNVQNNGPMCEGDALLVEETKGGYTYDWTAPNGTKYTSQTIPINPVQNSDAGTYSLTVTDGNGCSATVTTDVVIYDTPDVTANNSGPVCIDGDVTVSSTVTGGTGPFTYAWTHIPSGATYNTDAFTINNVTLAAAGEYQLIVTDANLCSAVMASTIVVVNDNPTVTLPLGPTTICEGEPLTITATATGGSGTYNTYTWYHNGIEIPGQTAATLTIDPVAMANMGAYTVIVTDSNGCVSLESAPAMVVVIPFFKPTVGNDSPVCEGGDVQLTCDAGPYVKYTWTGPNGFTSDVQNPPISGITLAGAGTYSLTVEDMNGCTGTETTDVIVNPNPTVTASNTGPVCQGGSVDITATPAGGTGPYTYVWQKDGNPITPVSDVFTINPVALTDAGLYSVTVTDDNTCSSTVPGTTNLVVNANPTVSLAYNNPVCDGSTLTLTATPAGGSGVYNSYVWTKGGVVIPGETASTLTINPATLTDAGDYGVTVIDNIGCTSAEDVINVVINALPAVNASSNSEVCVGDQLELYGEPASMTSYTWTGPNSFSNNTEQNPIVSANATLAMAGTYTLEVFDGTCRATATTDVVVNTVTAVLTTTPAVFTVCEDTELTFSANGQDGSGDYNYEFFVDGATQGPASTDKTLSLIITADVSVEVEVTDNVTGCKDRASTSITMIAKPVVAIQSPNDGDAFCESEAITFVATPGYTKYEFFAGPSASPTLMYEGPNNTYTHAAGFTVDTDVAVRATNASGCEALSTIINIVINARPTPAINGNTDVCFNSIEDYTTDNGSGESNWIWTVTGGTIIGVDNDFTVKVQWDGPAPYSISINYDNSDACAAETPSTQGITVNPLPTPTVEGPAVACNGSTQIYTTPDVGMTNYKWTVSAGGTIDGADNGTSVTIVWNTMGAQSVSLTYTDVNSCDAATPTVYNVNVTDLPSPTIDGSDMSANVCTEHTYTYFTEAGANNYDWQIAGGTITPTANPHEVTVVWNATGAQWISVNYDVAGCPAAAATVHNVNVSAVPVVAIVGNKELCFGDTETYEANTLGLGKGNYTWVITGGTLTSGALDEETINITWNDVAPYTISLNYVNANDCDAVNPTIENIIVNVVTAGLSADKTTICSHDDVTFTATGGVTYEFIIDGNPVVGHDGSDTYVASGLTDGQVVTVRAIGATGCDDTHAGIPIAVNTTPTPVITSGPDNVCNGDAATYTAEGGYLNYVWSVSGGDITSDPTLSTIDVDWNIDGVGEVKVIYESTSGCVGAEYTLPVTVNALPTGTTFTALPSNNVIKGTDITFTATGGAEYSFSKFSGGVETELQARSGTDNLVVSTEAPSANPILVHGDIVRVYIFNAAGCSVYQEITVGVYDGITGFDVIASDPGHCFGSSIASISLSGFQPDITYELFQVGTPDVSLGKVLASAGTTTVQWTDVKGANPAAEFYVVAYYDGTPPTPPIEMNNRVLVEEYADLVVFDMSPTTAVDGKGTCGTTQTITLSGSEVGVNYQLVVNGISIVQTIAGTGALLDFGSPKLVGTYSINAVHATTACEKLMNGDWLVEGITVVAQDLVVGDDAASTSTDGRYCVNDVDGVHLWLKDSEAYTYELWLDGIQTGTLVNTIVSTGGPLDFGDITTEGVYEVAINDGGCYYPMANSVTVAQIALPIASNLVATEGGNYCNGNVGVELYLDAKEANYEYSLYKDGVFVEMIIPADNIGQLNFTGTHTAGEYSVTANVPGITCERLIGPITVTEIPLPDVYTLVGDKEYCIGGADAILSIPASQNNVKYTLYRNPGDNYVDELIGDGNAIQFAVSVDGSYYLTAETINPISCTQLMNGTIDVVGVAYPSAPTIAFAIQGSDCDEEMVVELTGVEDKVQYELVKEVPIGSGIFQATGNIVIGDPTSEPNIFAGFKDKNARYYVRGTRAKCPNVFTGTQIDVNTANSLERFSITGAEDICNGDAGITLGLSGSELQVDGREIEYSLYLVGGNTDGTDKLITTHKGTGAPFTFDDVLINEGVEYYVVGQQIPASDGDVVCPPQPMLASVFVNINPLPIAFEMVGSGYYCDAAGASIGISQSEEGVLYQLQYTTGGISRNIGAAKPGLADGSGFEFTDGAPFTLDTYKQADGVFTIVAYNPTTLCTSSMNGSLSLTVKSDFAAIAITSEFDYCSDVNGILITTDLSEVDAKYTLVEVGVGSVITVDGTGTGIDFGYRKAGTYRIDVAWGEDGCSKEGLVPDFTITERLNPIVQKVSIDKANVCGSQDVVISIAARETGVEYYLYELGDYGTEPPLSTLDATDVALLNFATQNVTVDTDYEVYAGGTGVCERLMGFVAVSVKSAPNDVILTSYAEEYCADGEGVELTIENTQSGVGYQLVDASDNTVSFVDGTNGTDKTFTNKIKEGTYHVVARDYSSGCYVNSADVIVIENELPVIYELEINNGDGSIEQCLSGCIGLTNVSELELNGSQTGYTYSLLLDGLTMVPAVEEIGTANPINYGTQTHTGVYTVLATSDKGCQQLMNGHVQLSEKHLIAINDIVPVPYGKNVADTTVWKNDISDSHIDVNVAGADKNIFFSLVDLSKGTNVDLTDDANRIMIMKTDIGNEVQIYDDGKITFTKLPSFYGRDSIDYVVFNTDYLDRRDTARVYFFAGNIELTQDDNLLIPNAFSPNGDNLNDEFVISGNYENDVAESKLEVYNRWGSLVYRSNGTKYNENFWDGKSNAGMVSLGPDLPSGTYFYVFKIIMYVDDTDDGIENGNNVSKEYTGFIELRR